MERGEAKDAGARESPANDPDPHSLGHGMAAASFGRPESIGG